MPSGFREYLKHCADATDRALDRLLPKGGESPATLHRAIRYCVFPGGKRIRPAVVCAVCESFGGRRGDALPAACAVELMHSYSLVHDDLPCMDDADTRRGRPSCHVKFGEAMAVLVGDALQALAFEALRGHLSAGRMAVELAAYSGSRGLVGGQVLDLEKSAPTRRRVMEIHLRKTAALFECGARLGALSWAQNSEAVLGPTGAYGRALGLLFQTVDDLLDREEEPGKLTVPGVLGVQGAFREAQRLAREARRAAGNAPRLRQIVDFVFEQAKPPQSVNGHPKSRKTR